MVVPVTWVKPRWVLVLVLVVEGYLQCRHWSLPRGGVRFGRPVRFYFENALIKVKIKNIGMRCGVMSDRSWPTRMITIIYNLQCIQDSYNFKLIIP